MNSFRVLGFLAMPSYLHPAILRARFDIFLYCQHVHEWYFREWSSFSLIMTQLS